MLTRTTAPFLASALLLVTGLPRLASAAPVVEASPDPDAPTAPAPTAVHLRLGLGAPTGVAGLELERALTDGLTIAGGVGVGSGGGAQAALTVRLRHLTYSGAVGLGAGASYGDAQVEGFDLVGDHVVDLRGAAWANGEAYVERHLDDGIILRATAGLGRALRSTSCTDTRKAGPGFFDPEADEVSPCTDEQRLMLLPSLAVSIGKAF